jgi:hypothetical protein
MRRRALLGLLLAAGSAPARAADPLGIWALDRRAWQTFVADLAPRILARMPKGRREALEARGLDVAAEIRAGLSQGIEGTIELRPGGSVVARNGRKEADGTGLWRNDGEVIEIDLPAERLLLRGSWRGDRMELRPVLDPAILSGKDVGPLWLEAARQATFVLVREG